MKTAMTIAALALLAACSDQKDIEKREAEIRQLKAEIAAGAPASAPDPGQSAWTETREDRIRWLETRNELAREKQAR